ncbi:MULTISPECIES: hypothetical protein [unclassified Pseudoclavibacter]|uniref:hypothetical protein n=1 Tax=unclassified Pseudoclavibacter TaxID=2615177 RepID=UPI002157AB89|nr:MULTISPECIES: hypothetical protein [unclassified Pseudoclavibacter]
MQATALVVTRRRIARASGISAALLILLSSAACAGGQGTPWGTGQGREYPLHTDITATTFWVGEVFDADAPDGSQVYSTYDKDWYASYGGCDGAVVGGVCQTEPRSAANGYFPTRMTAEENPFYLDLPFDDVNDASAAGMRQRVVPWAGDAAYSRGLEDPSFSLMKNRWVQLEHDGRTCYGQIQDAGPGEYDDAEYVFGAHDARPANERYGGAGMDVSPALNSCLGFAATNGVEGGVSWRFVDEGDVPDGPWSLLVTTSR